MADQDHLTTSLSESVLTLICFDRIYGTQACSLVTPDIFEPPLDDIAARILEYRERYREPPGQAHIDDIFDHVLSKADDRRAIQYRRILEGLLSQASTLNAEYVFSRVRDFVRLQRLKNTVFQAAQRYNDGGDTRIEDIEHILFDGLKSTIATIDLGTFLDHTERSLGFLTPKEDEWCELGIEAFDRRRLVPTRKELYLLIAPRKTGKTWFCIHCGKMALWQKRWRVCHITLEVSEEIVAKRYYQSLLSISTRPTKFPRPVWQVDEKTKKRTVKDIEWVEPKFSLNQERAIRKAIDELVSTGKLHNLVTKYFPSGSLTMSQLENYLDTLERVEHFVPDMLIVDAPYLMKINPQNYRHDLGQYGVQLRGLAGARNMAVVIVMQGQRAADRSSLVRGDQIAEDISLVNTADMVATLTRNQFEKMSGTARMFASNARNEEDSFIVLLVQSLATAQFCLTSYNMGSISDSFMDDLKGLMGNIDDEPNGN